MAPNTNAIIVVGAVMMIDKNQRKRHRILDLLFRREEGYTIADLVTTLEDEFRLSASERTIKSDIKTFKEEYHAQFDETLPKVGKAICYRYADRDFSVFDKVLSEEDRQILASLLETIRDYEINPNYSFFVSLLEYVVTHQSAKDIELDTVQFSNNSFLKGLEDWFRPLLDAITNKQVISIVYCPFGKESREYAISPYLLKQFNDRWFLVARVSDHSHLSTFALDRIEAITVLASGQYVPVNLDEINQRFASVYGITGAFDDISPRSDIVLNVSSARIGYIDTKPISPCQKIEEIPDCPNWYRLIIPEMIINKELISLLLSFGADVVVVSPDSLRETLVAQTKAVLNNYLQ